ncbi:hypothetical protein [Stenotrophomonas sp. TWI587]|jgi:hypothetical protein|uniref:hypothetical protein n=1 Tax=Stenotrophomonas sp. TWI587 TaxID=3136783 RepID=UPI003209557E
MQLRTVWLFGTLTTLGLAMPLPGQADGLIECNNCASPEQVALASGPGLTEAAFLRNVAAVMDAEQAERDAERLRQPPPEKKE